MQTSLPDRLNKLIEALGTNSRKFALSIQAPTSKLSSWLNGKSAPNYESFVKITDVHKNVNIDWLVTGRGEMFIKEPNDYSTIKMPATPSAGEPAIMYSSIIQTLVDQNSKLTNQVTENLAIQREMAAAQTEMAHTQRLNAETIRNLSKQQLDSHQKVPENTG